MAPIVARGVLIDVPSEAEHAITSEELERAARTDIRKGDVVLVRTGWGRFWADPDRYLKGPGVSAAGCRWLIDKAVRAVGADNMAFDVIGPRDPDLNATLPGHILFLVRAGIPIIENLNLEELAAEKVHEFVFVCLPLKMRGATGSPVRPIAIA